MLITDMQRNTAANWTATNPILGNGRAGEESDTGKFKLGDGVTRWNALAYFTSSGGEALGSTGRPGFLPIDGKAADSEKLDGLDSTAFLLVTGKAADSDKLDGLDSTAFHRAGVKISDSDLLDGLDQSAFARMGRVGSGVLGGESTVRISSLNAHLTTGVYDGAGLSGAPDGDWWLTFVVAHQNPTNGTTYQTQTAHKMTGGGASDVRHRRCNGSDPTVPANWSGWQRIAYSDFRNGGQLISANNIFAHQGDPNGWETRIGEIYGFPGMYAPSKTMNFALGTGDGWTWRNNGNIERMYLTGDGRLIIGVGRSEVNGGWHRAEVEIQNAWAPRIAFHQPGQTASSIGHVDGTEDYRTYDNGGGGYRAWTASAFFTASASKYKEQIQPLTRSSKIMDLKPKQYKMKKAIPRPWESPRGEQPLKGPRKTRDDETEVGLLAEDVHAVLPHLVQLDGDGKPEAVNYVGLIPYLLQEVQALRSEVTALQAKLINPI